MILGDLTPEQVEVQRQKWAFMNKERADRGLKPIPMPTDLELSEGKIRFASVKGGAFVKTTEAGLADTFKKLRADRKRAQMMKYGGAAAGAVVLIYLFTRKKKRAA